MRISIYHGVQYDLPWSLNSYRYWSNENEATTQEIYGHIMMSSSLLYNLLKVQVYIMWIKELSSNIMRHHFITGHWCIPLTNARQPIDNESRYQGTEYILTSVTKVFDVEHLKTPSIKRHWCIPNCQWRESLPLMTANLKVLIRL